MRSVMIRSRVSSDSALNVSLKMSTTRSSIADRVRACYMGLVAEMLAEST